MNDLEQTFYQAPLGMYHASLDGSLLRVNAKLCQLLGRPQEALVGESIYALTHPEHSTETRAQRERLSSGQVESYTLEKRLLTPAGAIWVRSIVSLLRGPDHAPSCLLGIVEEIGPPKRGLERLLLSILDKTRDFIGIATPQGKAIYVNEAGLELVGFDPKEDPTGRPIADFHPEETARFVQEDAIKQAINNGSWVGESMLSRKDKSVIPVSQLILAHKNSVGEVEYLSTVIRDITALKMAEEALREREALYRSLVEQAADGIFLAESNGKLIEVNTQACQMLGYTHEELLQRSIQDIVSANDRPRLRLGELSAGLPVRTERRLLRKDGSEFPVEVNAKPVAPGRILALVRDITEWAKAEQALRERKERLSIVFNNTSDMQVLLRVEPDGRLSFEATNRAALEMIRAFQLPLTPEQLIGQERKTILRQVGFTDEMLDWEDGKLQAAIEQRAPIKYEMEIPLAKRTLSLQITLAPVFDSEGRASHFLWSASNNTERKEMERALKKNEEQLSIIFNNTSDMQVLLRVEPGGKRRYVAINRASQERLQRTLPSTPANQILGMEQTELFTKTGLPGEWQLREEQRYQEAIQTKKPLQYETESQVNQNKIYLLNTIVPILDASGEVSHVLWSAVDITVQRLADERIREDKQRLRSILDSIFGFVGQLTPDGAIVDGNRAAVTGSGLSIESIAGKPFWSLEALHRTPGQAEHIQRCVQKAASGEPVRTNLQLSTPGGDVVLEQDTSFAPIRGASGEITGVVVFGVDVTEHEKALLALQERERQLAEAQHMAKLGSWDLDLVKNQLRWSDEIFSIFEIDPIKFGASYEAFLAAIHPDDREAVNQAYLRSVREHTPYQIEHRLLMQDGRIKYVIEQGQTFYAADGTALRSLGMVQDITERTLVSRRLEQSLREKETLLREVHHRVKNNLQIIYSLLYFQSKKVKHPDDLAVFNEGRDRLRSMILIHEKLYSSSDLASIDFSDYVRMLVEHLRQSYTTALGSPVVLVEGERVLLPIEIALPCGMIVSELAANTFKYAFPRGGGRLWIRVSRADHRLRLEVGDDGIGLPESIRRGESSSFGMRLVRSLVEQVGASLTFGEGPGAQVLIDVPFSLRAPQDEAKRSSDVA